MSAISCHDPDCRDDADELARDTMVGCVIAFCEDHIDDWLDLNHINEVQ